MMRCPWLGSRPVVSVSRMICRIEALLGGSGYRELSGLLCLQHALVGQRIGALVFGMAGMAAHPFPLDAVQLTQCVQLQPKILVLHRLAVGRAPVALFPAGHPF